MPRIRYECPHCHQGLDQPTPSRLEHPCPQNRNRITTWVEVGKETT